MARNEQATPLARSNGNGVYPIHFEAVLAQSGQLYLLEREGLVPSIRNPNPHHPITEEREHDQWWAAHPEQARQYCQRMAQRQTALQLLNEMYRALQQMAREREEVST